MSDVEEQTRQPGAAGRGCRHAMPAGPAVSHLRHVERGHEAPAERAAEGKQRSPVLQPRQEDVAHHRRAGEREAVHESAAEPGRAPDPRHRQFPQEDAVPGAPGSGGRPENVVGDVREHLFPGVGGEGVEHPAAGREIDHGPPIRVPGEKALVALPFPENAVRTAGRMGDHRRGCQAFAELPGAPASREVEASIGAVDRPGVGMHPELLTADQAHHDAGRILGGAGAGAVELGQVTRLDAEVFGGDLADFEHPEFTASGPVEEEPAIRRVALGELHPRVPYGCLQKAPSTSGRSRKRL